MADMFEIKITQSLKIFLMPLLAFHIHINGIVQGVGFRPYIYNLAIEHQLNGWVCNSANGVDIEVTGDSDSIHEFLQEIPQSTPPLAQIDSMETNEIELENFTGFNIIPSINKATDFIPISPDVAICENCLKELMDPKDRRYRYPFINCTNCGPRFTIIKEIPYDRPFTTMADFEMCSNCQAEYENPQDRRFHAQPIACPDCGPMVWFENRTGQKLAENDQAIYFARQYLKEGKIIAIKGLGGFHLACDATNSDSVRKLRERKHRTDKPFALMAPNVETIRQFADVSNPAIALLTSPQAPIVLMPKIEGTKIVDSIAPHQSNLGFMLPYTPLHQLMIEPELDFPSALVMTSGNHSEEPILHENIKAREGLSTLADGFLLHDRPIHIRIDDSVLSIIENKPYPIRRARGYAPNPIRLTQSVPQILAVGPQMKNTFCLTREKYAFLSHYIGEMENWETYKDFQKSIEHYERLFRINPEIIAHDMHPDYLSTRYANERASEGKLPTVPVQHHHAHLAAALMENKLPPEEYVGGLIFDGTGYGSDGTIWGGEVLIGNCQSFDRLYFLKPVPLPGGDVSIQKPARMALSTLWSYKLDWEENLPPVQALNPVERALLKEQLEKKINTPLTSSMGRLFDVVSALLGVRETITYEAQAAIELESLVDQQEFGYYPFEIEGQEINLRSMLSRILEDINNQVSKPSISARFHNTIAQISLSMSAQIEKEHQIDHIVLSGGVWQNLTLLRKTLSLLRKNGYHPIIHHQMPPNDGCVAFGQAMVAAYRYQIGKE